MTTNVSLQQLADDALRAALLTQYQGLSAVLIDSPPGAGKTGLVERLAVQGMAHMSERVMVVTQTNAQACDLARRLAVGFPHQNFTLFVKQKLNLPDPLWLLPNLTVVRSARALPTGPCVVIANAARWSWTDSEATPTFHLHIIDEAYQLPDHRFHQIAGMAERIVLIGDPGQIAPVITIDVARWRCDPAGPQVAAAQALAARHPDIVQMTLPLSRRLVQDTVQFVQPTFYPCLPFEGLSTNGERRLCVTQGGGDRLDLPIELVAQGASLVQVELEPKVVGEVDTGLVDTMISLIDRLITRGTVICMGEREQELLPDMIGVVCAHISQVNAVRARLPEYLSGVFVETADRFQGLEKPVMLVYHPLSGRTAMDQFHLDAGRLCVMLSRHSVAAFIIARGGLEERLEYFAGAGSRPLGATADLEFEGWQAHRYLIQELCRSGRVIQMF